MKFSIQRLVLALGISGIALSPSCKKNSDAPVKKVAKLQKAHAGSAEEAAALPTDLPQIRSGMEAIAKDALGSGGTGNKTMDDALTQVVAANQQDYVDALKAPNLPEYMLGATTPPPPEQAGSSPTGEATSGTSTTSQTEAASSTEHSASWKARRDAAIAFLFIGATIVSGYFLYTKNPFKKTSVGGSSATPSASEVELTKSAVPNVAATRVEIIQGLEEQKVTLASFKDGLVVNPTNPQKGMYEIKSIGEMRTVRLFVGESDGKIGIKFFTFKLDGVTLPINYNLATGEFETEKLTDTEPVRYNESLPNLKRQMDFLQGKGFFEPFDPPKGPMNTAEWEKFFSDRGLNKNTILKEIGDIEGQINRLTAAGAPTPERAPAPAPVDAAAGKSTAPTQPSPKSGWAGKFTVISASVAALIAVPLFGSLAMELADGTQGTPSLDVGASTAQIVLIKTAALQCQTEVIRKYDCEIETNYEHESCKRCAALDSDVKQKECVDEYRNKSVLADPQSKVCCGANYELCKDAVGVAK